MNRRAFIVSLAGAAGVPMLEQRVAHAQQPPVLVVGYLNAGGPEAGAYFAAEFRKGLAEAGYIEGRNVAIIGECRGVWCPVRYGRVVGWVNRYYIEAEGEAQEPSDNPD